MAQIIVIGENASLKCSRHIEFSMQLDSYQQIVTAKYEPHELKFIELICSNYGVDENNKTYDLMFGYDDPENRREGVLFIGQFNDGII